MSIHVFYIQNSLPRHIHTTRTLELSPHNLVQVFGEVSDILGIQACHGYPAVRSEVNVSLLGQGQTLFGADTSEAAKST